MIFTGKHDTDVKKIKNLLDSKDVIYFEFTVAKRRATAIYIDSITDKQMLGDQIIRPLSHFNGRFTLKNLARTVTSPWAETGEDISLVMPNVLDGKPCFIIDGLKGFLCCDLKKFDFRAISEPPLQTVTRGPREGFNESIKTNLSLIRRRIKSENLCVKVCTVGRLSQTAVAVLYVKSIADCKLADAITKKIKSIDIDSIADSSYVAKLLCENKNSIFKQINTAEKPDVVTARMMEGRIAILVDGSPIALTLPYLLIEDFQNPEDYYTNVFRANVTRYIRLVAVMISCFLPAFYVASQLFHLQFIPLNFLLTIVNSIKGIPLSPSFEMLFILIIFEVLSEASIRMPKYVGMALSVVGALVLGDTAVRAGIVSTPAILIMSLSAISLYTVPDLVDTLSLYRIIMLIVAGSIGAYGIILVVTMTLAYLCSLSNFGTPILSPFSPLYKSDLKDSLYLTGLSRMTMRPLSLQRKNKRRLKD